MIYGRITDKDGKPVSTDWWIMRETAPNSNQFDPYVVAGGRSFIGQPDGLRFGGDSDALGYISIPIHSPGARFRLAFNVDRNQDTYAPHQVDLGPINAGTVLEHNFTVESAPTFTRVFDEILSQKCIGCHRAGGVAPGDWSTKEKAYAAWVNKPAQEKPELMLVKPGDADNSWVYIKVDNDNPPVGQRMPLGGPKLSDDLIDDLLEAWIDAGAKNN